MADPVQSALLQSIGMGQQAQTTQQGSQPQAPALGTSPLDTVPRFDMAAATPSLVPQGTGISAGAGSSGAVRLAQSYLGTPYQWGGTGAGGIDCSGLVQQVYGRMGVSLPRTTYEQMHVGQAVGSLGSAAPGDLVFFHDGGHVGIYLGGGQMIDANHTGGSVGVRSIQGYGPVTAIRRVA